MPFLAAIKSGFRNYANFKGRASRSEFWWWSLFALVLQLVTSDSDLLGSVVSLGLLIPGLAVHVRRLHDTNRSGWWMGAPIIAIVVALIGLITFGVLTAIDVVDGSEWDPDTAFDGVSAFAIVFIIGATLVAVVLGVVNLVFLLKRSQPTENRFGPPPPPRTV